MAINSNVLGDKNPIRSLCSSKTSNLSSCRLIQINFAGKDSCTTNRTHGINCNKEIKSPYFTNDKVQLLSRVTAKKFINKNPTEFISSFPLAASVYKANSDEFKLKKRGNKKVKKSVLTLPNEPAPIPQTYTVSDVNDSEYFNTAIDNKVSKPKRKRLLKHSKKSRVKGHAMELCDRDDRYCSQLNINLDCSSSEIINFTGDGERISRVSYKSNNSVKTGKYPRDVWAVLRNLNKLQFAPSCAPSSNKGVVPLRKRPIVKRRINSDDTHFIETSHTEEFAYISSFEVDSKSHGSCSPSTSFDRVTVIDKQSEHDEIMQQFSQSIFGSNLNYQEKKKCNINNQIRGLNKPRLKNYNKKVSSAKKIRKNQVSSNTHDQASQLQLENIAVDHKKSHLPEVEKPYSITKPIENCCYSDNGKKSENNSINIDQVNYVRKYIGPDDTCKRDNMRCLDNNSKTMDYGVKTMGDSEKQINGISKVILSKGHGLVSTKLSEPQRKPRLALTLPNTKVPKLSRFEIKRRLASQKYPIVILGKDQLTNRGICVANVDPPQFDGLDKHIWPFMMKWSDDKHAENIMNDQKKEIIKIKNQKPKHKINYHDDATMTTDMCNVSKYHIISKKANEDKKEKKSLLPTNCQIQLATEVSEHIENSKPLLHLKSKMFKFLHKNPTAAKLSENVWSNKRRVETVMKDKQVGTTESTANNGRHEITVVHKEVTDKPVENKIVLKSYSSLRHPWAKGKWASDFIENIIKKIRSGVYYSVEHRDNKYKITGSEASTQTEINTSKNASCQNIFDLDNALNPLYTKDDPLENILGFDKSLTTVEIETISTNQIAIKHCVTNVVVHFDIQVLGDAKNVTHTKKSMSCIPVDGKDSQEKVFKCNTSIFNSILPAELCSMIPTMMQTIWNDQNNLFILPAPMENIKTHLSTLAQMTGTESPELIINPVSPGYIICDEIRPIFNGNFSDKYYQKCRDFRTDLLCPIENMGTIVTLLPKPNRQIFSYSNQPLTILHIAAKMYNTIIEKPKQKINRDDNYNMALQRYEPKKFSVMPFVGIFSVTDFMKQIAEKCNVNELNKNIKISFDPFTYGGNISINRSLLFSKAENQKVISLNLSSKVGVISLFNAFRKSTELNREQVVHQTMKIIESTPEEKEKPHIMSSESKTAARKKKPLRKVSRTKSFVRCYRKCNSMSCISSYKCTPLSRVTNLEEFCQVLGSNAFSHVLDGCLEKKIIEAIEEMKKWITEISPKQALLILLLANKKDTSNLIRFKPVILQGIAVNRITKADELDTEIEVIEKENFHKLAQASDYQKTFDESSEKLLKSLLEKRKKLNPSYLRVMARYVGLGLLAPIKSR